MREYGYSDIGDLIGTSRETARQAFDKLKLYVSHPSFVDSDKALVKAYIKIFKKEGRHAARKEVARRIKLGKEIRRLREMYLDYKLPGWYHRKDD